MYDPLPIMEKARAAFTERFQAVPTISAYAPGRVEVLGNHTDYNEGFVLSAAINFGIAFVLRPRSDGRCRLVALDLNEECTFEARAPTPSEDCTWSNYVKGVLAGIGELGDIPQGFDALFTGDIPLGAGLSSSAALEMVAGKAFMRLYGIEVEPIALAKIGQRAEHEFAGVKCGLLDQISSLYGKPAHLVMSDFRSLEVQQLPLGKEACFLMCNTHAKHALVDGEYNERRAKCEEAAAYFAGALDHPVSALRDVSWAEWESHREPMDPLAARRAAHPIGENDRVLQGQQLLAAGDLKAFGALMFASHESSRTYFENSCPELDTLVAAARGMDEVLGARLSGGGFGGSAVVLLHPKDVASVSTQLQEAYARAHGQPCDIAVLRPSAGARWVD